MADPKPRFFRTQAKFREWLEANHLTVVEQWVGFYKKHTGKPSIDWPESVDAALCFGWIDGLRRSLDADRYMIRFTPRKPNSHWSRVNLARMEWLLREKLVTSAGLRAYEARDVANSGRASHEQDTVTLASAYEKQIRRERSAWRYYSGLPPSTMKRCNWWIMSAKQEATRQRRLELLIEYSTREELAPPLVWTRKQPTQVCART